jgi:hypothetical protein
VRRIADCGVWIEESKKNDEMRNEENYCDKINFVIARPGEAISILMKRKFLFKVICGI